MIYFGKTTNELSEKDFSELSGLFNNLFSRKTDPSFFKHKYCSPYAGFSYHGLMYNDSGNIAGALTFIPFAYQFFDKQIVAGCAADLMINEGYRKDFISFKRMYDLAIEKSGTSIDFLYAVPNSNAYLYWTRFLKWREIGRINYYVQILNISKIKTGLRILDWISRALSYCSNMLVHPGSEEAIQKYPIFKVIDETFKNYRFNDKYSEISESDKIAYYTIADEMGIKTAFIIDIVPCTKSWIGNVVKKIHSLEKKNIDIIIYIGNNLKTPVNLLKVPRRFEPRSLHLIGNSLSEKVDDRVYNPNHWLFNLSDFDVR